MLDDEKTRNTFDTTFKQLDEAVEQQDEDDEDYGQEDRYERRQGVRISLRKADLLAGGSGGNNTTSKYGR